jgi:hypothetical protein
MLEFDIGNNQQLAQSLKSEYWGSETISLSTDGSNISTKNPGLVSPGVNLVAYGRPDQHSDPFDIIVTYGVPFSNPTDNKSTMRVVKGVHITGFGQTIAVDGEPIIETYPFLARELI